MQQTDSAATADGETGAGPALPPLACDCHLHVFGPPERFPGSPDRSYDPREKPLADYERMAAPLGLERAVFVQPSGYGFDNRCQLEALAARSETARAVVVVDDSFSSADLEEMDRLGVRGARLNLMTPRIKHSDEARERLHCAARRIHGLGWHLQIYTDLDTVAAVAPLLKNFPEPVVFDHMGGARQDLGVDAPGFAALLDLLSTNKCWVKLSGADIVTWENEEFSGAAPFARALIGANPDRLVWGSDWPHLVHQSSGRGDDAPSAAYRPVNEAALLRFLADWAGGDGLLRKILVENPRLLYRF